MDLEGKHKYYADFKMDLEDFMWRYTVRLIPQSSFSQYTYPDSDYQNAEVLSPTIYPLDRISDVPIGFHLRFWKVFNC
uniref:Uncharacterized protein n=1 Tax=Oryza barthii TaxID=65489 RepID=A0A0D3GGJ2_9ORYZ